MSEVETVKIPFDELRRIVDYCDTEDPKWDEQFALAGEQQGEEHRWEREVLFIIERKSDHKLFGVEGRRGLTESCDSETFEEWYTANDGQGNAILKPVEQHEKVITFYEFVR